MLEKQNNQTTKNLQFMKFRNKERNTFENSVNPASFIGSFPPIRIRYAGKKEPLSGKASGPFRLLKEVDWPLLPPTIIPTNLK